MIIDVVLYYAPEKLTITVNVDSFVFNRNICSKVINGWSKVIEFKRRAIMKTNVSNHRF